MQDNDPRSQTRAELLAVVRREFSAFYLGASGQDAATMDTLVLVRAAFLVGMSALRDGVPSEVRMGLERTTDAAEQTFLAACDVVRTCPRFLALGIDDRAKIERDLFTVPNAKS